MFKSFWFLNILLSVFSKVASRDAIEETLMPPKLLQVQKLIDMFLSNLCFYVVTVSCVPFFAKSEYPDLHIYCQFA